MTWMIYGANGYTGRLVADLAVQRGEQPVLAGRGAESVARLATARGLEHRIFDLADPAAVDTGLDGIDLVVHCAGPFSATSRPMVDGCLRNGAHYLDITGEVDVFESIFARDEQARGAGVVLLPGVGFDVVPTDCLAAAVAAELPTATRLDLAFQAGGGISGGTLKSALEGAALGGRVRVDGQLRDVPMAWRRREVPFPSGPRKVASLPWGDVATAYRSTGIGTITTFARLPGVDLGGPAARLGRLALRAPGAQALGKAAIGRFVRGPGEGKRSASWVEVYAEATDPDGTTVSAALIGPDTYDFTADSVLRSVAAVRAERPEPGAHTPSTAFGADFVRRMHGVRVIEPARVSG
ncbi:saccharopine dehydrogenase NADP-binding domain-containing protein [Saccharopolyspora sp. HNM0983]|uniref:Saccharopine dehydrogenase NADP-binding domain-containing protein n=1 Tax=Saccharopolyspora montiporae TaxID=2781240 RepID=A0A929B7H1_9PSEU|nr:saccharopine dehydrogenase NADP-binding domain-containing protein [Saccharopolyspora sp. HNM0983]MBE9374642.1 saccharopine dehydrogenase NADP-binding domain-containing protein [Saccharopolyspora sp. HNM0983]